MLSITLIFSFFSFSCMNYSTIDYNLKIQYGRENKIAQGRRAEAQKSTIIVEDKAVMAFLIGKLEQLFYLAHSFSFFLGEIQLSEQQQKLGHQS